MKNQPPNDEPAEQAALGAMLLSKDAVAAVTELLTAEHFYRPVHGEIFDAITGLVGEGEPVDPVTVARELEKRGQLSKIGAPYLHTLMTAAPTPAAGVSYARTVHDKWRQRQIIRAGQKFLELGYAPATSSDDVDALLGQAEAEFKGLGESPKGATSLAELIDGWREWMGRPDDIIATPWSELNDYLGGGLRRGKVYIIGGRPGAGKSLASLNIAAHAAESNLSSLVFSMEMGNAEITSRLLAGGAWAEYNQIFRKRMDAENWHRVEEYIDRTKGMKLEVVDKSSITVEQISALIKARKPDVAMVDYLQLITMTAGDSRREKIDHVSRMLKVTAGDCNTAIVVASQLNRAPATGGRAPTIADLRESGGQEADADVVMLLHRPEDDEGIVLMHVGKNRDGKLGTLELTFRGKYARIGDGG